MIYCNTSATGATPLYCYRNETSDVNFIATAYAKLCDAASDYAIVGRMLMLVPMQMTVLPHDRRCAISCYGMLYHTLLRRAAVCHAMLRSAKLCYTML